MAESLCKECEFEKATIFLTPTGKRLGGIGEGYCQDCYERAIRQSNWDEPSKIPECPKDHANYRAKQKHKRVW